MTDIEKRTALAALISPDTDDIAVLDLMVKSAGEMVLNRMYPFGYPETAVVPARYEQIQIQLAAELYTKRGAEGQSSHSENGITRTWPEQSQLLNRIMPHVGSVVSNA